jgi:hypothetical protein
VAGSNPARSETESTRTPVFDVGNDRRPARFVEHWPGIHSTQEGEEMKLSHNARDQIVDAVLRDKGFPGKITAAEAKLGALVKAEWEKTVPAEVFPLVGRWVGETRRAYVRDDKGNVLDTVVLVGTPDPRSGSPAVVQTPEIRALRDAVDAVKKEAADIKETVRAVVYSCNTDKQLLETAPELGRFLPEAGGASTALVDMATINKLRNMLGGN